MSSSFSQKFAQLATVAAIAGGVFVDSCSSDNDVTDSDSTHSALTGDYDF